MHQLLRAAATAAVLAAVLGPAASVAGAIPPPDPNDPPIHCPRGYVLVDGDCVKLPPPPPPPPPAISPKVTVDLALQTTGQNAVRVVGWTTDAEQPTTPLTIRISVDGTVVRELSANLPRPDVGPHGYDETVAAPDNVQQVCVTALNVGPTGHATIACQNVDNVVEFQARDIVYDIDHLQITSASPMSLDTVTNTNSTTVQQSTTISGSEAVEESHKWETAKQLKVTASASFKIPFFTSTSVSIEGQMTWTQGGTTTTTHTFSWQQPVLVPAKSKVVATVGVTKTAFNVPFTLTGDYLYESGFLTPGTDGGMFTGVNGHDLDVTLKQFNLDGTPAAVPVAQPAATLLKG
jgi:hypothetical protein